MDVKYEERLVFFVNGKKVIEDNVDPEWTLLQYLRTKLRLCGTKLGCAEGGCGACTVMVSKYDRCKKKIIHLPVNACLTPICSMHGLAVTTVEGIGSIKTTLHPVQERIAKAHGSQCGFCTPGIVMSMYTLLRNMEKPPMKEIETAFQGNLCRCTGYRPIVEAFKTFSEEWEIAQNKMTNGNGICAMGENCCKNKQSNDDILYDNSEFALLNKEQELIFPPELKINDILDKQELNFKGSNVTWYRPINLNKLLKLKSIYPDAKIIVGNTEIGVEVKFKNCIYATLITPTSIEELTSYTKNNYGITIGSAVTLDDLEMLLKEEIKLQPDYKTRIFKAIVDMLQYFAGKQIRSVASIGGNIITGSPISDLNPIFMAAQIELQLQSINGSRKVRMDENFYTGYRKTILEEDEILVSLNLPYSEKDQYFYAHKQARRRDDDIAIVNSAININFEAGTNIINNIKMAFGGVAPTTKMALNTSDKLIGRFWNYDTLELAYQCLLEDLPIAGDAPGGMIEYRKTLPLSFFFRTYLTVNKELQKNLNITLDSKDLSALDKFKPEIPKTSQFYQLVPDNQNPIDTIGRPIIHASALKQATGEAIYLDDIPKIDNEIYLAFVYSKKSHADIISLNFTPALNQVGVIGYLSATDVPENRLIGPVYKDEELFVTKTTTSQYQYLGAILAEDQITAKRAANSVVVKYKELPVIITIEEAIKHNSFFKDTRALKIGNTETAFKEAKHVIEGECRTGYQEHFYLETHGCLVIPKEEDDMEIFCSTQNHAEINDYISNILGIKRHKLVTRVKRIGGGFGGKQSRGAPIALSAAIAARKFKRPVRVILDRDEDMAGTGGRHPYLIKYKAGFNDDGQIIAYEAELFSNSGYSYDLSLEVLDRAVFHIENSYKIPNLKVKGYLCKTNLPSNTAFRGFGAPQSMFAAENMIRDVAEYLNKDPVEISMINLYKEGDITHYNQHVTGCNLKDCMDQCLETSNYYKRKEEVEVYNKNNRWKKRGISVVCTKYGVGFGVPFLEQAGALVIIYIDGSVLLTHSGVEMGQGLNTKMIQIASRVLKIPVDNIYISECATDKVPNSSPTAASVGSDLNGMAVMRACETIIERLKPIMEQSPKGTWEEWIKTAYFDRISLSATGFYCTPDVVYDWDTNTGKPYNYYTYGVACTEVEIDCLTGDHQVLRTDIVMDLGSSLNPAIDIGQIEGGFMQGYGLFVLEELVVSPTGTIYSKGPGSYKIPGFGDIPIEFNVGLLKGVSNPRAVYSSKAVGEPPLFLASSALFAIREAVKSARKDAGITPCFRLNAPATADKIRMACQDDLTEKVIRTNDNCHSWSVIL